MVAGVESAGRPLRIGLVLETTRSQSLHIRQTFELDLYPFCCSILFVSLARCSMLRHWRFFFSGSDRNPCFFVLFYRVFQVDPIRAKSALHKRKRAPQMAPVDRSIPRSSSAFRPRAAPPSL
jgi:hypothetical protein